MKRTKAYRRCRRNQAIQRKLGILRRLGGENYVDAWTHGVYGRLAKGKIHCSCPMCRTKSYDEASHRDKKAQLMAEQQMNEIQVGKEAIPNEEDDSKKACVD